MNRIVCLAGCMGFASVAAAQDIHKCMTATGVAYQSAACGSAQAEVGVLKTARHEESDAPVPTVTAKAAAPTPITARTARWTPSRHASIALGMSDDQILNIPEWGRPRRIVRSREHKGWRETWTYDRADGVQSLSFFNSRLTDIGTAEAAAPPPQIASATQP